MEAPRSPRLEKALVLLLLLTLLLPLLLTTFVHFTAGRPGSVGLLRRMILDRVSGDVAMRVTMLDRGWADVSPLPLPTFAGLRSASYQEGLAKRFNDGFAGRSWIHRCTQEAYLRLFNTVQGPAILGRHHSAYYHDPVNEPLVDFVPEYCVERLPADTLEDVVKGLRLWRDSCQSRGVGFAIVITPSKAALYPEDLPAAWLRRYDPRPRAYDNFVRLLQQEHIRYVDGHLIAQEAKARAPAPVFPLGGTHWGQDIALQTTNAVLRELASQGQPLRPITDIHRWVDNDPTGEDADLINVIQPLIPWKYPVTHITYPPVPLEEGRRPSLTMIGGSFVGAMAIDLYRSQQFSEIHWLRYYRRVKEIFGWEILAKQVPDLNVEKEVYPAQCLVLEVNEQLLINPFHLRDFFADTLKRMPGPGTPKLTFPYETFLPCRWNEPIGFSASTVPTKPNVFSGLSQADPVGSWSNGPDTTMRLIVPDLDQDAIVSVFAGAASIPNKRPAQRVSVYANGQPVAEWVYDTGAPQTDTAVIPKSLLGDGRLVLRFHYSNPTAPSEYSNSQDVRKLAVLFVNLTLRQPYRRVDGPVISAAAPQADPVYVAPFSRAEPFGRWTVGSSAALRLPVPAGEGAVTLSAELGAVIIPEKLPVQRTSILVNGQPVGEWVFFAPGSARHEVTIPRTLLKSDHMEVEFRFSKTISLAEIGTSKDTRQFALLFQNVQLHWLVPDQASSASPAPNQPVSPYEAFLPCRWNEPIGFSASTVPTKPNVFSGLSQADPVGSWSNGPDTTMRLIVPDLDQDAIVSVFAGAASIPNKRPAQRVSVYANGQPVAEWVYDTGAPQTDTAVIPKSLLGDGRLVLRFHYSNPTAPSEYSNSQDVRKLAVLFLSLTLSAHFDPPVSPGPAQAEGK